MVLERFKLFDDSFLKHLWFMFFNHRLMTHIMPLALVRPYSSTIDENILKQGNRDELQLLKAQICQPIMVRASLPYQT